VSAAIPIAELVRRIEGWIGEGKLVIAPVGVGDRLFYQALGAASEAVFDARRRPANSIKEFFFPRHEGIFRYRIDGPDIALSDVAPDERERIVIAAKPCDAAALPILDRVFNWDYEDEFYTARRARTTVISLACAAHDEACFCTSVGLGPAAEAGADAMLVDVGEGCFEARAITEKGRALFGQTDATAEAGAGTLKGAPQQKFDAARVTRFLDANFESPLWQQWTLACLGCGACAYTCPSCHCFDIVDEGNAAGGARVKNWDSCQFPLFTLHASGHNPRSAQPQRQRQRLLHKFSIYPRKFDAILCTGCGNCERNCPVGMGVRPVLEAIDGEARRQDEKEPVQA
jgi:ferredoxin